MRTNWPTAAALAFAVLLASRTSAQTPVPQAAELRTAFAQAKSGSLPDDARVRLAKHPLRPWLDALAWRSGIAAAGHLLRQAAWRERARLQAFTLAG